MTQARNLTRIVIIIIIIIIIAIVLILFPYQSSKPHVYLLSYPLFQGMLDKSTRRLHEIEISEQVRVKVRADVRARVRVRVRPQGWV